MDKKFGITAALGLAIGVVSLSAPVLADTIDTYTLNPGTSGLEAIGSFTVDLTLDTITAWDITAGSYTFENGGSQSSALLTGGSALAIHFSKGSGSTYLDLYVAKSPGLGASTIDLLASPQSTLKVGGEHTQVNDVSISAVPLPASAWLMLSGLVGLGAMVPRRRAA